MLKHSNSDVIVSQKGSIGDGKVNFFERDHVLLALFAQKYSNSQGLKMFF